MEEGELEAQSVGETQRPGSPPGPPSLRVWAPSVGCIGTPSPPVVPAKCPLDLPKSPAPFWARNELRSPEYLVVSPCLTTLLTFIAQIWV